MVRVFVCFLIKAVEWKEDIDLKILKFTNTWMEMFPDFRQSPPELAFVGFLHRASGAWLSSLCFVPPDLQLNKEQSSPFCISLAWRVHKKTVIPNVAGFCKSVITQTQTGYVLAKICLERFIIFCSSSISFCLWCGDFHWGKCMVNSNSKRNYKGMDSGARLLGFEIQAQPFLLRWLGLSWLTSLCLKFFTYKIGVMVVLIS